MPSLSSPIKSGLNSSSGARNREGPICRVKGQLKRLGLGPKFLESVNGRDAGCSSLSKAGRARIKTDPVCKGPQGAKIELLGTKQGIKRNKQGSWENRTSTYIYSISGIF